MPTQSIAERAMLVTLSITQWTANKLDSKVSREVADRHGNDVSMGRFNKSLVVKEATQELRQTATNARTDHYKFTLPWSDSGPRILSQTGYFSYCEKMRVYQSQWEDAVDKFVYAYPDLVCDARRRLNGLFNPADYPDVRTIRDKFSFGFNVRGLSTESDFRVDLGTAETARIKADIESSLNATIETAMADVFTRIKETVGHLSDRLRAYTIDDKGVSNPFRDSLVTNVRELVSLLPMLNITGNPKLAEIADRMNRELCVYSPDTLRASTDAREETAKAAESILRTMEDFI